MRRSIFRVLWDLVDPLTPAHVILARSRPAHRVLAFARELIKDKRRWTTGVEMRRASGYETSILSEATSFCAAGAVRACATTEQACDAALAALAKVIRERRGYPDWWCPCMVVSRESDKQGHKDILLAVDEALRRGGWPAGSTAGLPGAGVRTPSASRTASAGTASARW